MDSNKDKKASAWLFEEEQSDASETDPPPLKYDQMAIAVAETGDVDLMK